jgi:hypothetical protein
MLDLLGNLLTGAVPTSQTPGRQRGAWWRWLLLFLVFGVGGAALALYAWLETLEVTR